MPAPSELPSLAAHAKVEFTLQNPKQAESEANSIDENLVSDDGVIGRNKLPAPRGRVLGAADQVLLISYLRECCRALVVEIPVPLLVEGTADPLPTRPHDSVTATERRRQRWCGGILNASEVDHPAVGFIDPPEEISTAEERP